MNNGSEFLEDNLGCLFLCKDKEHTGHVKHHLYRCQYYHCRRMCANTIHYTISILHGDEVLCYPPPLPPPCPQWAIIVWLYVTIYIDHSIILLVV